MKRLTPEELGEHRRILEELRSFGVSNQTIADRFGISRAAPAQWKDAGIPAERFDEMLVWHDELRQQRRALRNGVSGEEFARVLRTLLDWYVSTGGRGERLELLRTVTDILAGGRGERVGRVEPPAASGATQ